MVEASVEAWESSGGANGKTIRMAVGDEHKRRFLAEVKRLTENSEFKVLERDYGNPALYLSESEHAYWFYSVLGQEPDIDTDLWTVTTRLTYATDYNGHYPVLDESGKVGIYRNPEFCAVLTLAAAEAHKAAGFIQLPVTEQYTRRDLNLFASIRGL